MCVFHIKIHHILNLFGQSWGGVQSGANHLNSGLLSFRGGKGDTENTSIRAFCPSGGKHLNSGLLSLARGGRGASLDKLLYFDIFIGAWASGDRGIGGGSGRRGSWGETYILQGPAFGTFIQRSTGDRSRPTPVRVAIKSNHDILP